MKNSTVDAVLKNTIIAGLLVIPFIPLYVANNLFFPFITGKAFAFRILVEIIFAIWLILMLRDKKYSPKFSSLSIGVTIFMIMALVADLLGVNPMKSIWSNFERMEGWLTIIHLWAYFIVITSVFGTGEGGKKMWHRFFNASIIAATIVSLYGIFQLFGWAAVHQGSTRIDASLGNAAYMAVYMLFHTFMALYMSFVERSKKKISLSWMYIILAVLYSFILFETGTRGTIIGLVGGIVLVLGIYAIFGKRHSGKSRWSSAGIIIAVAVLIVLFYANKNAAFIQKNDTLQRLAAISINDTKTQARGYVWPMAVKGVLQSPKTAIIGWGQEDFNYIFNTNYNPKMWDQEQWFDRAHNVFLDWLVAGGIVGLLTYLSLFVLALVAVWRNQHINFIEKTLFTGLLAAYAVHNIFVFDNLISYIMFFTILGFFHSLRAEKPVRWLEFEYRGTKEQVENKIVVRDYIFVPVTVIAIVAVFYFVNVRTIQANTRLIQALVQCSGSGSPSIALFEKSLELNQYTANQETREQLIDCAQKVSSSGLPEQTKIDFYNLTKAEIENQIKATPNDARIYTLAGAFMNSVGDWASGKPILEKAHELSPGKQSITFELATNYMNSGKEKEAADLLEKAYMDAPENPTAKVAYASTLVLIGQESKAHQLFPNDPDIFTDQRVINAYLKIKQYSKVVDIYKQLVAKDPNSPGNYASLAAAYYLNGQTALAIADLKTMEEKFPELKPQIEPAIKELQEGKNPFGQ